MDGARDVVVIGVDPRKRSVTIEARDAREVLRATGSFPTTTAGHRALLRYCRQWPRRVWAVEGAGGVGRPLAARLLAEGERVLDVPAKLSARVRVLDTGHGRKTDATDAHAVVMAALRDQNQLRELSLGRGSGGAAAAGRPARRVVPVPRPRTEPAAPADDAGTHPREHRLVTAAPTSSPGFRRGPARPAAARCARWRRP
jgi:hypothetical protein